MKNRVVGYRYKRTKWRLEYKQRHGDICPWLVHKLIESDPITLFYEIGSFATSIEAKQAIRNHVNNIDKEQS